MTRRILPKHCFWRIWVIIPVKQKIFLKRILQFTESRETFAAIKNQVGYEHINAVIYKLRHGQSQNIPDKGVI
jgi:hypothetical protein